MTYGFLSMARDRAGNEEVDKTAAEATTTVADADTAPPLTTAAFSAPPNKAGWHKADVTVTLSSTDEGSGVKEIRYSATGAQPIPESVFGGAALSITILTEAETMLTYLAVDDAGNLEQARTTTVRLDGMPPTVLLRRATAADANGHSGSTAGSPGGRTKSAGGRSAPRRQRSCWRTSAQWPRSARNESMTSRLGRLALVVGALVAAAYLSLLSSAPWWVLAALKPIPVLTLAYWSWRRTKAAGGRLVPAALAVLGSG